MDSVMSHKSQLIALSKSFFEKHWGIPEDHPEWDFSWEWIGPVPYHKFGGLYALLNDETVLYIGLGNSRGAGIYQEHGISRRLLAHVLDTAPEDHNKSYLPKDRWHNLGVTKVATLGFPNSVNYLAPALEDFLIGELNPIENSVKRKNA